MYKLSGVTKNYAKGRGTVAALRGVDLVVEDGEWLAIQGPPGTASRRCCRSSAAWTARPRASSTSTAVTSPGCARPS